MSLQALFNRTVSFERPTTVKDSSGGPTRQAWSPVSGLQDVPAAVQPLSQKEKLLWMQRNILNTHRIYLASDTAPHRDDRIRVDTGEILIITGVQNQAGRDRVYSIDSYEHHGPQA